MKRIISRIALIFLVSCTTKQPPHPEVIFRAGVAHVEECHAWLGLASPSFKITPLLQFLNSIDHPITLQAFDGGWPHSFGSQGMLKAKIESLLGTKKVKAFVLHNWWDPGHRLVTPSQIKASLTWYQREASSHPEVVFYDSPQSEYSCKNCVKQVDALVAAIRAKPPLVPILSPMNSYVTPGVTVETHGSKAQGGPNRGMSADGQNLPDMLANQWVGRGRGNGTLYVCAWGGRYNLAESGNSLPPNARTANPSLIYIQEQQSQFTPEVKAVNCPAPTFGGRIIPIIGTKVLQKITAEDLQGNQSRDNLPLMMFTGVSLPSLDPMPVLAYNGTQVAQLGHFGDDRWYSGYGSGSGKWSFQIAARAIAVSGSPCVWYKASPTTYYGPVDAGFREPFGEAS